MSRDPLWTYDAVWKGFRINSVNQLSNAYYGVYLIEELATGRCYVGCSSRMRYRPMQLSHKDGEPGRTIRREGKQAFGILPLYCSIAGKRGLYDAEAALIASYDAASYGFNVVPSELDRSNGNSLSHRRPHIYAEISEGNRRRNQQDSTRDKQADISRANWNDPKVRSNRMKGHSRPEVKLAMRLAKVGKVKITNGRVEKLVPPDAVIPEGWQRGRVPKPKPAP